MEEVKQHFIQTCSAYSFLKTTDALEILRTICAKYNVEVPEDSRFKKFVEDINDTLNRFDHDIAFLKYPICKEEFLVFRSLNSKVVRFLHYLFEQDLCYFRLLMKKIAASDNYGIQDIEALNLSTQLSGRTMPKNRADELLQAWKRDGYFYQTDSQDIMYFGPRMVIEFGSLLLEGFPDDVKECSLCKSIVLWDSSCSECQTKFHSECIRKYLIKKSNCPACQRLWNTAVG